MSLNGKHHNGCKNNSLNMEYEIYWRVISVRLRIFPTSHLQFSKLMLPIITQDISELLTYSELPMHGFNFN